MFNTGKMAVFLYFPIIWEDMMGILFSQNLRKSQRKLPKQWRNLSEKMKNGLLIICIFFFIFIEQKDNEGDDNALPQPTFSVFI